MSVTNNPAVSGQAKLECMVYGCHFKAKVWVSHNVSADYDLNGVWHENGVRNQHVCPDCRDELTAVFGWWPVGQWPKNDEPS